MVSVIELNDKVPRITRGNDFVLGVHLVENRVVGYRRIEQREIEGEVTISEVKLVAADKRRTILSEGEAVNGSNTWHLNPGNNVIINFFDKLPIGRYGIEIIFTVGGLDKRFYLEPGTCFNIVESSPDGFVPAENVMTYQADANTGLGTLVDMSDYYTKGQMNDALQKVEQSVGYFECSTAGGTAAKTVTAPSYALRTGGSMKIKMTNANTASTPTLNINATGAKPIYYNGTIASPTNSWEAGEVIEVYYDGKNYQATNFQGGGGKAEKIKYDNTQSGMEATNAQAAIDELKNELTELAVGGITLSASVNPTVIEVGKATSVTIKGTASKSIDTLNVIYGGTTQSANTATSVQKAISVTPSAKTTYNFTVTGTHKGVAVKSATGHFYSTYKTFVGAGTSAANVVSGGQNELTLSLSAKTYNVSFGTGQYLFIVTPLTVTLIKDGANMEVDFSKIGTYETNWNVYRSDIPMLDNTTIKFTITAN